MRGPRRKEILTALDAAMGGFDEQKSTRLQPHFVELRNTHRQLADDERVVGYGFPGNGSFFQRARGASPVVFYTDKDHNVQALKCIIPQTFRVPGSAVD